MNDKYQRKYSGEFSENALLDQWSTFTFSFLTGSVVFSLGSLSSGISRIMLSSFGSRVNTGGEGIFSIFYINRMW